MEQAWGDEGSARGDSEEEQPCAPCHPSREQGLAAGLLALCFLPTVPPAVNVTRSQDSEGMVHLTCRAFGFFPRNISVAWFRNKEPMSRDTLESGVVLPDGNGTYYTWETIVIPQGEEQQVKCLVEHNGNHSTHLAPLGETGVSLEGVVTLGRSEARVRERRAGCGSGVPGMHIIRSFFRNHPSAPEITVDHRERYCCCSCCCCYHRILCL